MDVAVVGAGALGLAAALRLARAGLSVRVLDRPRLGRPNASTVAAGMLAPVSETLAEGGDQAHLHRLLLARDHWPAFAQGVDDLVVDRTGTELLLADEAALEAIIPRLSGWGIKSPRLIQPQVGVRLADDWRLDAVTAMATLRGALARLGVVVEAGVVEASDREGLGPCRLTLDGAPLAADRVVIAAGYGSHELVAAAPELGVLAPIKGQIVAFQPAPLEGPTLRRDGLYVAPQGSGARAGASMEAGRDDTEVEPAVVDGLHRGALALQPQLGGVAFRGEAGVRAATPDGWPLVGASTAPGVFLATGARRNGWLLAPLISRMICEAVTGGAADPQLREIGQAFHPGRFTR